MLAHLQATQANSAHPKLAKEPANTKFRNKEFKFFCHRAYVIKFAKQAKLKDHRGTNGEPVTLRFADKIGEILTASANIKAPPLAFKYYI